MSFKIKNSQITNETLGVLNQLIELDINASAAFKLTRIIKMLSSIIYSDKIHQSWKNEFLKEDDVIKDTEKLLGDINPLDICPSLENTFKCFELVSLSDLKVVIWGQDPYPTVLSDGTPRAQGYAFGVRKDDEVPASLKNIYKEIKSNYPNFKIPNHGDLSKISPQGVLFMNYSLLYCISNPLKYRKKWMRFTNMVIRIINENKRY